MLDMFYLSHTIAGGVTETANRAERPGRAGREVPGPSCPTTPAPNLVDSRCSGERVRLSHSW
ncbi:hypothetical protein KILIM_004_00850 [Kineosphaera limosa NBRC 100340]|uniref:Uncharacterized protein n=1 Tax=Kineosphaera limosa NBRC 100340 TaxID=1184609 RepID=K6X689_9MICO|nr:hypothetical protein KILIM_004_00850 [Kineosphaera limosa NBRC 100340]